MMRNIKIVGCGAYLPNKIIKYGEDVRYRCSDGETQLDLAEIACENASYRLSIPSSLSNQRS